MAEIFLSYANEDRETAAKVAALLESAGWTVWWDRRIPAGRTWRSVIEDALTEMRCMVVLWSSHSIDSHWVKEEAEEARTLEKLVPVLIEPVNPPVGFRSIQAADLTDFDGSRETEGSRQLIADLQSLLGNSTPKSTRSQVIAEAPPSRSIGGTDPPREERRAEVFGEPAREEFPARETAPQSDDPSANERSSQFTTSHRGGPVAGGRRPFNLQAIGAGAVALAVALAALWLWPKEPTPVTTPETAQKEAELKLPEAPRLVRLGVKNSGNQFKPGESRHLLLEAEYSDGTTKEIKDAVAWSSSDTKIAQVDASGQVKAVEPGAANITARYGGVASSDWVLTVEAPPVVAPVPPFVKAQEAVKLTLLSIGNVRREMRPGEKVALRLRAKYSDGSERYALNNVEWHSSDRRVAAITSGGELEALSVGRAEIRARAEGLASAPMVIRVAEAPKPIEPIYPKIPEVNLQPKESPQYPDLESLRARLAPYLSRARSYRAQGNYTGALGELERARALDPSSAEVRKEFEQTRKACNAEKSLGYNVNCG